MNHDKTDKTEKYMTKHVEIWNLKLFVCLDVFRCVLMRRPSAGRLDMGPDPPQLGTSVDGTSTA